MKNKQMLSKCFAILALIVLIGAIIAKLTISMDVTILACVGGSLIAASLLVKE